MSDSPPKKLMMKKIKKGKKIKKVRNHFYAIGSPNLKQITRLVP